MTDLSPIHVSDRLPNPEDCDAEGQCWWFYFKSESQWNQWVYSRGNEVASYWLPYHALPLPQWEDWYAKRLKANILKERNNDRT